MPSNTYATPVTFTQTGGATLSTLPDGSGAVSAWVSEQVDNSTTAYPDALVTVTIPISGTPAGEKQVIVYGYGSITSTLYQTSPHGHQFGIAGSASSIVSATPASLPPLGPVLSAFPYLTDFSGTAIVLEFNVASAFGGVLPPYWGIVIRNASGVAFGSGCSATYSGVL